MNAQPPRTIEEALASWLGDDDRHAASQKRVSEGLLKALDAALEMMQTRKEAT